VLVGELTSGEATAQAGLHDAALALAEAHPLVQPLPGGGATASPDLAALLDRVREGLADAVAAVAATLDAQAPLLARVLAANAALEEARQKDAVALGRHRLAADVDRAAVAFQDTHAQLVVRGRGPRHTPRGNASAEAGQSGLHLKPRKARNLSRLNQSPDFFFQPVLSRPWSTAPLTSMVPSLAPA
jgi:hypothetical protein